MFESFLIEKNDTKILCMQLSYDAVVAWFDSVKVPTPTGFALAFGIDPDTLHEKAAAHDQVLYALHKMVAFGESMIFDKVTGSVEYVNRVRDIITKAGKTADKEDLVEFVS